jgi:UDP-2-acetamido-3-amino-2,3-dideoxy-glucuronate N-acetyltransferase
MARKKKFIAQVGLGYWGKNILRNLYELGVLHTACDALDDTISSFKEKYPDIDYTSSLQQILASSDIKAVAVSSPAVTHYDFVKKSLLAGKDVFVEKPLSLTVKDATELVDIAEKEGRILMVGHILQYHPAVIIDCIKEYSKSI